MKKIIIIIFLFTISCSNNKVVKNHGFNALETKIDKIVVLKDNKNDVLKIIGKPSTVSLFDENSWFYIVASHMLPSVVTNLRFSPFFVEPFDVRPIFLLWY